MTNLDYRLTLRTRILAIVMVAIFLGTMFSSTFLAVAEAENDSSAIAEETTIAPNDNNGDGAEETTTKKDDGAEETTTKKDDGTEETTTKKDDGTEETTTKKDDGTEETTTKKDDGTEETTTKKDDGTKETTTKKDDGTEETTTKKDDGAEETTTKKDDGTEETTTKKDDGTEETTAKPELTTAAPLGDEGDFEIETDENGDTYYVDEDGNQVIVNVIDGKVYAAGAEETTEVAETSTTKKTETTTEGPLGSENDFEIMERENGSKFFIDENGNIINVNVVDGIVYKDQSSRIELNTDLLQMAAFGLLNLNVGNTIEDISKGIFSLYGMEINYSENPILPSATTPVTINFIINISSSIENKTVENLKIRIELPADYVPSKHPTTLLSIIDNVSELATDNVNNVKYYDLAINPNVLIHKAGIPLLISFEGQFTQNGVTKDLSTTDVQAYYIHGTTSYKDASTFSSKAVLTSTADLSWTDSIVKTNSSTALNLTSGDLVAPFTLNFNNSFKTATTGVEFTKNVSGTGFVYIESPLVGSNIANVTAANVIIEPTGTSNGTFVYNYSGVVSETVGVKTFYKIPYTYTSSDNTSDTAEKEDFSQTLNVTIKSNVIPAALASDILYDIKMSVDSVKAISIFGKVYNGADTTMAAYTYSKTNTEFVNDGGNASTTNFAKNLLSIYADAKDKNVGGSRFKVNDYSIQSYFTNSSNWFRKAANPHDYAVFQLDGIKYAQPNPATSFILTEGPFSTYMQPVAIQTGNFSTGFPIGMNKSDKYKITVYYTDNSTNVFNVQYQKDDLLNITNGTKKVSSIVFEYGSVTNGFTPVANFAPQILFKSENNIAASVDAGKFVSSLVNEAKLAYTTKGYESGVLKDNITGSKTSTASVMFIKEIDNIDGTAKTAKNTSSTPVTIYKKGDIIEYNLQVKSPFATTNTPIDLFTFKNILLYDNFDPKQVDIKSFNIVSYKGTVPAITYVANTDYEVIFVENFAAVNGKITYTAGSELTEAQMKTKTIAELFGYNAFIVRQKAADKVNLTPGGEINFTYKFTIKTYATASVDGIVYINNDFYATGKYGPEDSGSGGTGGGGTGNDYFSKGNIEIKLSDGKPQIKLTKAITSVGSGTSGRYKPSDAVEYKITLANSGPSAFKTPMITDVLPYQYLDLTGIEITAETSETGKTLVKGVDYGVSAISATGYVSIIFFKNTAASTTVTTGYDLPASETITITIKTKLASVIASTVTEITNNAYEAVLDNLQTEALIDSSHTKYNDNTTTLRNGFERTVGSGKWISASAVLKLEHLSTNVSVKKSASKSTINIDDLTPGNLSKIYTVDFKNEGIKDVNNSVNIEYFADYLPEFESFAYGSLNVKINGVSLDTTTYYINIYNRNLTLKFNTPIEVKPTVTITVTYSTIVNKTTSLFNKMDSNTGSCTGQNVAAFYLKTDENPPIKSGSGNGSLITNSPSDIFGEVKALEGYTVRYQSSVPAKYTINLIKPGITKNAQLYSVYGGNVTLTSTNDATITSNNLILYTVKVNNAGSNRIDSGTIVDTLPGGFTLVTDLSTVQAPVGITVKDFTTLANDKYSYDSATGKIVWDLNALKKLYLDDDIGGLDTDESFTFYYYAKVGSELGQKVNSAYFVPYTADIGIVDYQFRFLLNNVDKGSGGTFGQNDVYTKDLKYTKTIQTMNVIGLIDLRTRKFITDETAANLNFLQTGNITKNATASPNSQIGKSQLGGEVASDAITLDNTLGAIDFTYYLSVTNADPVSAINSLVIIDRLPGEGDIGVATTQSRGTSGNIVALKNAISKSAIVAACTSAGIAVTEDNINIQYAKLATDFNFIDANGASDLSGNKYWMGANKNAASLSVAGEEWKDIYFADANIFRIVIDNIADYKNGKTIFIPVDAVLSAKAAAGDIAWNSFGTAGTYTKGATEPKMFMPVEPTRVGIEAANSNKSLSIQKALEKAATKDMDFNFILQYSIDSVNWQPIDISEYIFSQILIDGVAYKSGDIILTVKEGETESSITYIENLPVIDGYDYRFVETKYNTLHKSATFKITYGTDGEDESVVDTIGDEGYESQAIIDDVLAQNPHILVTNTFDELIDLELTKTLNEYATNNVFKFNIMYKPAGSTGAYSMLTPINTSPGDFENFKLVSGAVFANDGTITLTLTAVNGQNGETSYPPVTAKFTGLSKNYDYKIVELDPSADYRYLSTDIDFGIIKKHSTSIEILSGDLIALNTIALTVKNNYSIPLNLSLEKAIVYTDPDYKLIPEDAAKLFKFQLYDSSDTLVVFDKHTKYKVLDNTGKLLSTGEFALNANDEKVFAGGIIYLKAGDKITFYDIPAGTYYFVEQQPDKAVDYRFVETIWTSKLVPTHNGSWSADVEVSYGAETVTVTATNKYQIPTGLTVEKYLAPGTPTEERTYTFQIFKKIAAIPGTSGQAGTPASETLINFLTNTLYKNVEVKVGGIAYNFNGNGTDITITLSEDQTEHFFKNGFTVANLPTGDYCVKELYSSFDVTRHDGVEWKVNGIVVKAKGSENGDNVDFSINNTTPTNILATNFFLHKTKLTITKSLGNINYTAIRDFKFKLLVKIDQTYQPVEFVKSGSVNPLYNEVTVNGAKLTASSINEFTVTVNSSNTSTAAIIEGLPAGDYKVVELGGYTYLTSMTWSGSDGTVGGTFSRAAFDSNEITIKMEYGVEGQNAYTVHAVNSFEYVTPPPPSPSTTTTTTTTIGGNSTTVVTTTTTGSSAVTTASSTTTTAASGSTTTTASGSTTTTDPLEDITTVTIPLQSFSTTIPKTTEEIITDPSIPLTSKNPLPVTGGIKGGAALLLGGMLVTLGIAATAGKNLKKKDEDEQ